MNIESLSSIKIDTSKTSKTDFLQKYSKVINIIRQYESKDKSFIATKTGLSWPTVSKAIKTLIENGIIAENDNNYAFVPDYGFYVGISFGARETKVSIIDSCFNSLDDDYLIKYDFIKLYESLQEDKVLKHKKNLSSILCFETPTDKQKFSYFANTIIIYILDHFLRNNIDLLGIGMSFPGIIDRQTSRLIFSPNMEFLQNERLLEIIDSNLLTKIDSLKISLYIAHDTDAIAVYEKENFYRNNLFKNYRNKKNIACLYLGVGLGLGLILENKLYTSPCEIGHIPAPKITIEPNDEELDDKECYRYFDENLIYRNEKQIVPREDNKCYCNVPECIERMIRINVFNSVSQDDYIEKTKTTYLEKFAKDHPYRFRLFIEYIKYLCTLIIDIFCPDVIILCGRIFNSIPELRRERNLLKESCAISKLAENCTILNGSSRADSVAIGAAIMSYHKLINSEGFNSGEMNSNIEWDAM